MRTNKTYHTSEDGTSFYSFQSTSFNSFGSSKDDVDVNVAVKKDNEMDADETDVPEFPVQDYPFDDSDSKEDNGDREELEENVGVDEGLITG